MFVGDFIFEGSIGRTDLGGSDEAMAQSLQSFLDTYSDDIILYPGHGCKTTIGNERNNLNYFIEILKKY